MPLRNDFTDETAMATDHAEHHNDVATALDARIPPGGAPGEFLGKASSDDHDTQWATPAGGGSASFVSSAKWGLD